jgi:maltose operon protein
MPRFPSPALPFLITLALAFALSGCAGSGKNSWLDPMESKSPVYTDVSSSAAESRAVLNAAAVCCDDLAQLRFEPVDIENSKYYPVNRSSQAFDFTSGKSFVRAFRLPDSLERATVTLSAVAGATVFVPTVLILDDDFRVSRSIDSDNFVYTPAGFMEPQRLRGRFHLDRRRGGELANERYFIVFTTDADLRGSTQMISEARLYARARGLADPGLPDPVAEHAATGVFRLAFGELETRSRSDTQYADERQAAERYVAPSATVPMVAPTPTPPPKPTAKPGPAKRDSSPAADMPMLNETQTMYDELIRDAVRNGEMDRAWRLVQEAERAGSTTARRTFTQAVEQK